VANKILYRNKNISHEVTKTQSHRKNFLCSYLKHQYDSRIIKKSLLINLINMVKVTENKIKILPKILKTNFGQISQLLSEFSSVYENIFYYSNPASDFEVLAVGRVISFESNYEDINELHNILQNTIEIKDFEFEGISFPLFFGYCKFPSPIKEDLWNDFKDSEWILPEFILYKKSNKSLQISFSQNSAQIDKIISSNREIKRQQKRKLGKLKEINSDSFISWEKKLNAAVEMIKHDKLKKIVLSRKKEFKLIDEVDFSDIIETLNIDYQNSFNFLIKSADSYYLGSSPELLAEINGDKFKSEALAGSIERGKSESEDISLSEFLLSDSKNLNEHQIVIDYLKSSLEDCVTDFRFENKPEIKKLKNIQHLNTKIKGQIKADRNIFNLISKIFPTPAVCGIPKEVAINELSKLEGFERGIFTGIIGWINFNKQAEFYVAIRSGLFKENRLSVFAGCGIVEDSVTVNEYNETELKLKVITDLFDVEN